MDQRVCRALGSAFLGIEAVDTFQDHGGLRQVDVRPAPLIADALRDALEQHIAEAKDDSEPCNDAVIKTGALGNAEIVVALVETLKEYPEVPLVVDPVRSSTISDDSTPRLLTPEGWLAMQAHLFPLATLVTPNSEEYADGSEFSDCEAVLLKGGHSGGSHVDDVFIQSALDSIHFRAERIPGGTEIHGTGCALSAAIASFLGITGDLPASIQQAHEHVHRWIEAAIKVKNQRGLTSADLLADGIWQAQ